MTQKYENLSSVVVTETAPVGAEWQVLSFESFYVPEYLEVSIGSDEGSGVDLA